VSEFDAPLGGGDDGGGVDGSHVPTGCAPVDDLLGGGFERGTVTQVYGEPAAGKTNIVLSAAVELADEGGWTLYVDTEGLSVERMEQLASAAADGGTRAGADGARTGGLAGPADGPDLNRPGATHLGLTVDDVEAFHAGLADDVATLSPPRTTESGTTVLFVRDPEGNLIEVLDA